MGAETSLEVQGRRTRGQQWDTYQVPGPAWGMASDTETERQGPCAQEEPVCVCVCVCACVLSVVYMYCVCLGVLYVRACCKNSGDLVVCPIITECY